MSSASASRLREPMTLPISSAFSGPTDLNQVARGLPSSTRGDVDEVDRLVVHLAFAELHQPFDKAAQAEPFGIGGGHRRPPWIAITARL